MTLEQIEALYRDIEKSIFTIQPVYTYAELHEKFIELANGINAYDGETEDWVYLGEGNHACLDDVVIGAFWHYTEWHAGQDSIQYAAYCALSEVFEPNMSCPPTESDDDGYETYTMLNEMAEKERDKGN